MQKTPFFIRSIRMNKRVAFTDEVFNMTTKISWLSSDYLCFQPIFSDAASFKPIDEQVSSLFSSLFIFIFPLFIVTTLSVNLFFSLFSLYLSQSLSLSRLSTKHFYAFKFQILIFHFLFPFHSIIRYNLHK